LNTSIALKSELDADWEARDRIRAKHDNGACAGDEESRAPPLDRLLGDPGACRISALAIPSREAPAECMTGLVHKDIKPANILVERGKRRCGTLWLTVVGRHRPRGLPREHQGGPPPPGATEVIAGNARLHGAGTNRPAETASSGLP